MRKPTIAITQGEPSGIGPEIAVKAIFNPYVRRICNLILIGDKKVFEKEIKKYNNKEFKNLKIIQVDSVSESILTGVELYRKGELDALVTAPASKDSFNYMGKSFPGHTEFLAYLLQKKNFLMMFVSKKLRIGLATIHIPIERVSKILSKSLIFEKLKIIEEGLKKYFNIDNPKIGVCGLNPHCGESGKFGKEESEIIIPAIGLAKKIGIRVKGPFSSDSIFYRALNKEYDAILAMYHDQGLIPIKTISFHDSVNVTLGLPMIRTSPAHGCAFDIAGKGIANPTGMIEAVKVSVEMWKNFEF